MRAQLKLLACHISGGEQSGTVFVNGVPIVEAEFKNQLAVVWQSDVLLATATVRLYVSEKYDVPQAPANVLLATATVRHIGHDDCYICESTHCPSPSDVPQMYWAAPAAGLPSCAKGLQAAARSQQARFRRLR